LTVDAEVRTVRAETQKLFKPALCLLTEDRKPVHEGPIGRELRGSVPQTDLEPQLEIPLDR
jgi:hypothetical protein